jgi:hypothetical protein
MNSNLKDPKNKNIFTLNILAFILIILVISVISVLLFISRSINIYGTAISKIYTDLNAVDEAVSERFRKLTGAELLLDNTNRILSTVYFGTADTDQKEDAWDFTAFSIRYNDKYYIITAGHSVEMDGIKYKNFRFKANNSNIWITPELLDYKNDYENNLDYAVFYSNKPVTMGLIPATEDEDHSPVYILGNIENDLNLIKEYKEAKRGESGSPVLNSKCHVIGILIKKDGSYTPIKAVLSAIEKLKSD